LKLECDNLFKQSNIISFISGTFIENDYICGYCIKLTNNERLSVMKNKSMLFNQYGSQLDYAVKKCDKYISDVFK
jgi:hypothetical protein